WASNEKTGAFAVAIRSAPFYPKFWVREPSHPAPVSKPHTWSRDVRYAFAANRQAPRDERLQVLLHRTPDGRPPVGFLHDRATHAEVSALSVAINALDLRWRDLEFLARSSDLLVLGEVLDHSQLTTGSVV